MSVLQKDSVKQVAEMYGFADLKDDVAAALSSDLEYRLRQVTQEAAKFMRHSKRRKLTTEDVNHALQLRNLEPVYGYSVLKIPGVPQIKGDRLPFQRADGSDAYYLKDRVVDLADFIKNEPVPKLPVDVTFSSHWLAVEGIQPAIPQNPPVDVAETEQPEPEKPQDSSKTASAASKAVTEKDPNVKVKKPVQHVLSKELQLYYQNITDGLLGKDDEFRAQVLRSIREDPGLNQLLPYFCQFFREKVSGNLRNLPVLLNLIKFVGALLHNPHLFMEPYLHILMPAIMTCIVGKKLSKSSSENHWALRDQSADLVVTICRKFGTKYNGIQTRITKTLVGAFLDVAKSLPTHYGALVTLSKLGYNVVDVLIVDNAPVYMKHLTPLLGIPEKQEDANRVYNLLLRVIGKHLGATKPVVENGDEIVTPLGEAAHAERYQKLQEVFGEKLQPFMK